ncbi:c-type cytochrome [Photobacterium sp. WH77]|uniref:c-type cytochrome n=1 Tax=unclassified Photobacterium TaxID=2628852 RepID=UPI001EDA4B2A|nr:MULTISPECIES: c-type cytochrome [unclassified Photobacterium]MCG2835374.1 c-type cytochrome [Photobacterium sp. WH77]MCG2842987.1 c-type cytochrome [Photobacterium sp. WH80]
MKTLMLFTVCLMSSAVSAATEYEQEYVHLGEVEPGKRLPEGENYHALPDWNNLPEAHFGEAVKKGYTLFTDTQSLKEQGVSKGGLNCVNCHLNAGRLAGGAPLWAAYVAYPAYRSKNDRVNTFEDRLQGCFRYSMNGGDKVPALDSDEIRALTAYSYWLATNAPVNSQLPGRGYFSADKPAQAPDFARGKAVYQEQCAFCHAQNGEGRKAEGRYVFPPLWGEDSYNWGAGMHQINTAAAFIKTNMPLGMGNTLTDQQAWDVALYINSQNRPQDPRFTGNVKETAEKYHAHQGMYGKPSPADKHILGDPAQQPK